MIEQKFVLSGYSEAFVMYPAPIDFVFEKQCCGSLEILVGIRIRRSVPLINGSGPGSCYFCHWPSRSQQKNCFSKYIYTCPARLKKNGVTELRSGEGDMSKHALPCVLVPRPTLWILILEVVKKSLSDKKVGIKVFLLFWAFCLMIEGSGSWAGSGSGSASLLISTFTIRPTDPLIHFRDWSRSWSRSGPGWGRGDEQGEAEDHAEAGGAPTGGHQVWGLSIYTFLQNPLL